MATNGDWSRSDLLALMWGWLDESYAELRAKAPGSAVIKGQCQAYARAIAHLADMSDEAVRRTVAERYTRRPT